MNALLELLGTPTAYALGWTLLHFVWQGTVIASGLFLLLRFLRSSQARYIAGVATLTLMAVVVLATFANQLQVARVPVAAAVTQNGPELNSASSRPIYRFDSLAASREEVPHGSGANFLRLRFQPFLPYVVVFWWIGATFFSLRLLAGWFGLVWLRHWRSRPASSEWTGLLNRVKERMGLNRHVTMIQSEWTNVPSVFGWLRPVILLPASSFMGLTPSQIEGILAHELSHIQRNDCLVNWIQAAIETVLFYHPAVWWVSDQVRQEREFCCDAAAVEISGNRVGYLRALTVLEELRGKPPGLALAATSGSLLQGARRISGVPHEARSSGACLLVCLGAISVLLLIGTGRDSLANQKDEGSEVKGALPSEGQAADDTASLDPVAVKVSIRVAEWKGGGLEKWLKGFTITNESTLVSKGASSAETLLIDYLPGGIAETNRTLQRLPALARPWILTPSANAQLLQTVRETAGVDLLSAPVISTLSGRQARVSMTEVKSIVMGVETNTSGVVFQPEPVELGISFDLLPKVAAGADTFHVRLSGRVFEFLGYSDKGHGEVRLNRQEVEYVQPSPRFRSREFTAEASYSAGHTLLFFGGEAENVVRAVNKVNVLGDLPWIGAMFRRQSISKVPTQLLILVTTELVDTEKIPQP